MCHLKPMYIFITIVYIMSYSFTYHIDCYDDNIVDTIKQFTETYLNDQLNADDVFEFFSNDVIFIWGEQGLSREIGWLIFKFFGEYDLVSIESDPEVFITDKVDYILLTFKCQQRRRRCIWVPEILCKPKLYEIEFESHIYFNFDNKINIFEIIKRDFELIPDNPHQVE